MSTFQNKKSLRTVEAEISKKFRTMRLSQNFLVLVKKRRVVLGTGSGQKGRAAPVCQSAEISRVVAEKNAYCGIMCTVNV